MSIAVWLPFCFLGAFAPGRETSFFSLSALLAMFPRGDGFYFHPIKLALVLVIYLMWVRTCWWVDQDCRELKLSAAKWNPLILGCGVAGLLLVWGVPVFWVACLALGTLYVAPTLLYVGTRNEIVSEDKRVLTPRHLKELAAKYLSLKFGKKKGDSKDKVIPIRFVGKSASSRADDPHRVSRAAESPQYRQALELVYNAILARRRTFTWSLPRK